MKNIFIPAIGEVIELAEDFTFNEDLLGFRSKIDNYNHVSRNTIPNVTTWGQFVYAFRKAYICPTHRCHEYQVISQHLNSCLYRNKPISHSLTSHLTKDGQVTYKLLEPLTIPKGTKLTPNKYYIRNGGWYDNEVTFKLVDDTDILSMDGIKKYKKKTVIYISFDEISKMVVV